MISKTKNPRYKYNIAYCNHRCAGVAQGKAYGFAAHPENTKGANTRRVQAASWARDWVWLEHLKTGLGHTLLARRLGMSVGTIADYLYKKRLRGFARQS